MDNTTESGLARDILNAVGVNFAAFVLAIIATFLIGMPGIPIGIFAVYGLLIGFYAISQIRKGRRRRAILTGSVATIALIFLIYVGTHLNIA